MKLKVIIFVLAFGASGQFSVAEPWDRHTIDNSSEGADGVRLADCNGDGKLDIVTGWEEGGLTRLYLHPSTRDVRRPWPQVTLGKTASVEDAAFVDLDGDGRLDVVSCCEGNQQSVFVHWNNNEAGAHASPKLIWKQAEIGWCTKRSRWMYSAAGDLDGDGLADLVLGSKNPNGQVSILTRAKGQGREDIAHWRTKSLCSAGWIMSLEIADVDRDGDLDVVVSDRRGAKSGIYWLENRIRQTPVEPSKNWIRHEIGLSGQRDVMFLSIAQVDDEPMTIVGCVKPNRCVILRPDSDVQRPWRVDREISYPTDRFGSIKSAAIGRFGEQDGVVISCESAIGPKSGLFVVQTEDDGSDAFFDVAGPEGTKYDRIELIDLDDDGDQDILTCEERVGLGVIWYENPGAIREDRETPTR